MPEVLCHQYALTHEDVSMVVNPPAANVVGVIDQTDLFHVMARAWAQNSAQPPTCGARLGLSSGSCALRSLLKRPECKPVTVVSLEVAERGQYQGGAPIWRNRPLRIPRRRHALRDRPALARQSVHL